MIRFPVLLFIIALFAGCSPSGEKLCAEAVMVDIAGGGEVFVNQNPVQIDEISAELASLRAACGAKLQVFLRGYAAADKATAEQVVSILNGSEDIGELQVVEKGEEPH